MFELIEKVRQKPERTKKRIAFFIALGIALIIFSIWASVVFPSWRRAELREAEVDALEPSPSGAFMQTISDGFSGIGAQLKNIKDVVSSFSGDSVYYSATSTATTTPPE